MNLMEIFVPKDPVICKSCGYIMGKARLRDKCPACGVPANMFEPYQERISPFRKLILGLSIHPVLVHFPQAFTFTILALAAWCFFSCENSPGSVLLATLKTLSVCLPFTVIISAAAGLFDAKIRFRKVTTQLLKYKIFISSLFIVFSSVNLYLALLAPLSSGILEGMLILAFACFICSFLLGLIGARLLESKFPG